MPAFINSIASTTPAHRFSQEEIAQFMIISQNLDEKQGRILKTIYKKSKIEYRHSVLNDYGKAHFSDYEFYPQTVDLEPFPTVKDRMRLYQTMAPKLATAVALKAINDRPIGGLTHLITVSCTGMYAPGLDIDLVQTLGLDSTIKRTAVNFMGCYGTFNALKMAKDIVLADDKAQVLIISVELCTLHFQKDFTAQTLLSNGLFADGAGAMVITSIESENSLQIIDFQCDLYLEGRRDMAWYIGNHGFEMILTENVPKAIQSQIYNSFQKLLIRNSIEQQQIQHYALHPGGRAILESLEKALGIDKEQLAHSYSVLQNNGNMSSTSIIFVLENLVNQPEKTDGYCFACAFGPGLTLETMLLQA